RAHADVVVQQGHGRGSQMQVRPAAVGHGVVVGDQETGVAENVDGARRRGATGVEGDGAVGEEDLAGAQRELGGRVLARGVVEGQQVVDHEQPCVRDAGDPDGQGAAEVRDVVLEHVVLDAQRAVITGYVGNVQGAASLRHRRVAV